MNDIQLQQELNNSIACAVMTSPDLRHIGLLFILENLIRNYGQETIEQVLPLGIYYGLKIDYWEYNDRQLPALFVLYGGDATIMNACNLDMLDRLSQLCRSVTGIDRVIVSGWGSRDCWINQFDRAVGKWVLYVCPEGEVNEEWGY